VTEDGDALVVEIRATGAKLRLEPWDGDIFIASLMPIGVFGPVVDLGFMTRAFGQFQMDGDGKLNVLNLSSDGDQRFEFRRE
jgi:hypothetical protein